MQTTLQSASQRAKHTYWAKQIAEYNGKNVACLNSNGCFWAIIDSTLVLLQSKASRKSNFAFSLQVNDELCFQEGPFSLIQSWVYLILDARLEVAHEGERLVVLDLTELNGTASEKVIQLCGEDSRGSTFILRTLTPWKRWKSSQEN